jgi:hypothetical protein
MLTLQPGMTVSGRLDFQGGALVPADLSRVRVSLTSRGAQPFGIGGAPQGLVDAAGQFTITGVPPGRYAFSATVPAGGAQGGGGRGGRGAAAMQSASGGPWTLKMAVVNGRDALDFPVEIGPSGDVQGATLTFTDRTQELSGTVQDATGRPTADFTIIVFPSDNRYWTPLSRRIGSARPGTDGTYAVRALPAGEYRLTAVTDVEPGEWYDPAFLAQLVPASIPISLGEGETKTQDIRLAGGR